MKKIIKFYSIVLFTILFLFTYPVNALTTNTHLVLDSDNSTSLPENFRKTTDAITNYKFQSLNKQGLDKLNISGSSQFTEYNLPLIIKAIPNNFSIIDIDLREESHGFINGFAISFENTGNNANSGLSLPEIIDKENSDLSSIKLNNPLTLYNSQKTIIPKIVQNENTLVTAKNIAYVRIPVTDGRLPNDNMVNYFIDFVKNQPENTWLHFHCKAGIGRTTTFMIMYDIIKNHNDVSLNDIITRQILLSNLGEKQLDDFLTGHRYEFLSEFYNKCKNNEYPITSFNSNENYIFSYNALDTFEDNPFSLAN